MTIQTKQYGSLLLTYLKPQWQRAALLAVLLLGSIALQLAGPQVLRFFIDTALAGGSQETLIGAAILFLGAALLNQAISVAATYMGEQVGWTATNALRADLALHCLRLDMQFHKTRTPGEMIERVDGDVTALANFFSKFVVLVTGNMILLLGVILLLFIEDWRMGMALLALTAVTLLVVGRTRNLAVPSLRQERQVRADLFGFLEERLSGLPDIRSNGGTAYVMYGFHKAMREVYQTGRKAWARLGLAWSAGMAMFALGYVVAFVLGAYLFQIGAITLGTVYLFYQYTYMLERPLEDITEQMQDLQKASASIVRVWELFQIQPIVKSGDHARLPSGPLAVEFDNVSFSYELEDEMVLKELSFRLKPGKVLGLLGRTGSGKTSMTRLLFRLYDPTEGDVRLGDVDIRAAALDELRRSVGMVTQDVQLFHATVRDNLTLFDKNISDSRILDVIRDVGLEPWYEGLDAGLDTELSSGGGGLSAGEAQLLAFARVFLKDPGLVVLDEASSRLDPATEHLIEDAVSKLMRNRTGIIIAHRLGTAQRADEIMILEDGRVREHGEREKLARDPASRFHELLKTGMEEALA